MRHCLQRLRGSAGIVLAALFGAAALFPAPVGAGQLPAGSTYLALGDSLAYGMQVGKLRQQLAAGSVHAGSFDTGYVDVLAADLKPVSPGVQVVDLGCPGESTASFIAGPCAYATTGKPFTTTKLPLHVGYAGAQLAAATDYLSSHTGAVKLITLDVGINDLRAVQIACPEGAGFADCVAAGLPAALERTKANLRTILSHLRIEAPDATLLVLNYYNWLAVTDPATDRVVEQLNDAIATAASESGAKLVDVFTAFNRTGNQRERLCELTLFCGPTRDLHPSDAGYRVIGGLLAVALGLPPR